MVTSQAKGPRLVSHILMSGNRKIVFGRKFLSIFFYKMIWAFLQLQSIFYYYPKEFDISYCPSHHGQVNKSPQIVWARIEASGTSIMNTYKLDHVPMPSAYFTCSDICQGKMPQHLRFTVSSKGEEKCSDGRRT